ncbi:MFS transporter [Salmonella enterica]|uniref:MFS transporter n=1 Tax=Salmonella enterica TaxID=28901 RepID=UPI000699DBD4|nr:MFS transporter [Salmonella enterica]
MPLALFALTISAFAIGTTEFVIVGLVPTIAQQLAISLPSAGMLVSIYALGVAIGAPVLTALTTILVMGVFAFGNVPGLQVYVVQKAEQFTPNAVDVASGLNIAAFNIGIALGSVIGGQTVEHYGLAQTPWIGALIVLVAFLLMGVSGRLDKPVRIALE